MKSWKFKILFPMILLTILLAVWYSLWQFPISTGKRVGNLIKISKKGKVWPFQTWEGTIDEGSGDQLTSYFSVRSSALAEELYNYEGRQVILYYEQYFLGWPWETNYNVTSWKPKVAEEVQVTNVGSNSELLDKVGNTLFCALLGSLYQDQELYNRVKDYIKENNLYLFKQIKTCNE